MISKGKRITGNPVLIRAGGELSKPERISFNSREFYEDWLQEIIYEHPELLPVEDIEPVFTPLIPVAREFPTNAGPIDNVFISPNGYMRIPTQTVHRFRGKLSTHSIPNCPVFPIQTGQCSERSDAGVFLLP